MKTLLLAALCSATLALNTHAALTALDSNGDIWTRLSIRDGVFHVGDGPGWEINPRVYSGLEAAEFLFGAPSAGTIYAISVLPDFVTHTAVLDGFGDHSGKIFAENYSLDSGNFGYADPLDRGDVGAAYSAFVRDGSLLFANGDANYVWRRSLEAVAVPEPSTWLAGLLLAMVFGVQGIRRLRQRKQTA